MARDTLEMFETDVPVATPQERTAPYTDQEAFDIVVSHLRKMPRRSINIKGTCAYRNASGLRCAIGALIPDGMYSEDMEGSKASNVVYGFGLFSDVSLTLLDELQEVHDISTYWGNNKELMFVRLYRLSKIYNLEWRYTWSQQ